MSIETIEALSYLEWLRPTAVVTKTLLRERCHILQQIPFSEVRGFEAIEDLAGGIVAFVDSVADEFCRVGATHQK